MNSIEDVKIISVNPRDLKTKEDKKVYQAWLDTWEDAIDNDLKVDVSLYSNDFTRQDEIIALYDNKNEDVIGMSLFRYIDFKCETARRDSYFKEWSDIAIQKLIQRGSKVAVCSYFTVCPRYREKREPFKWKDAVGYVFVKYCALFKDTDVMTGAVRVNKGVNESSYNLGAILLQKNVPSEAFKAKMDLVAFYKEDIISFFSKERDSIYLRLWEASFPERRSFRLIAS